MKLSVIIPVYNERNTVLKLIEKVNTVELPSGIEKELVVVDDGSHDGSTEILKKMTNQPNTKIFYQQKNQGKASAVKTGIENSTGDIIIIQDADFEYSPDDYLVLLEPILHNDASVVYGSRFKGTIKNMTFVNRTANIISNLTINLLYGTHITDINTCYKVFKREVLNGINIETNNFSFDSEITAKVLLEGNNIVEVPINYIARSRDEGKKINWLLALELYFHIIKLRFSYRPQK